jgi:hypothetical protein
LLAVSASFLPAALTGHAATSVPSAAPRVEATAKTVLLASSLGSSIPSVAVKVAVPKTKMTHAAHVRHVSARHHEIHHVVAPAHVRATTAPTTAATTAPTTTTVPSHAATSGSSGSYGCDAALAYLSAHAAPGFSFECPGYADGHQAMTCENIPGLCPGTSVIAIAVPCAAAYMNEASNSWVLTGKSDAPIDPYGYCG